jgi:lysophospholipase L1-like esterase
MKSGFGGDPGVLRSVVTAVYWKLRRFRSVWPLDPFNLERYGQANSALGAPAPGEERVVFLGDSITDFWDLKACFPSRACVNRGISGQTTPQMVLRFHPDVVALQPAVTVILGGTNDLSGNTGRMTLEQTQNNLAAMAEMGAANRIRVVLCSILPVGRNARMDWQDRNAKILSLNRWIENYAAQQGHVYVDYHSSMTDESGYLADEFSADGLHPLPTGYAAMTPLAEAGIAKALEQQAHLKVWRPVALS